MILRDTPPASPEMEENEIDEDEMVYVGDADEVLDILEGDENDSENEMEDDDDDVVPPKDDSVLVFSSHEGSVFCGSLNNDATLAATGGEDDKAFVWEVSTGRVILECKGHTDSVIFSDFSKDGTYLATADMSGVIQVWKISNNLLIWDYNMGDMTWMRWHSVANVLFGGAASGEIYMWKIPSGECKIFQSHGQRVEQGVLMPDGKRLAVGYEDGTLRIFDLKSAAVLSTISSDVAHNSTITALDCHPNNNLIISGAMDGRTILTTSQSGRVIGVLQDLKDSRRTDEGASTAETDSTEDDSFSEKTGNWVETIAFCKDPEFQVAASGTVNGQIFIWDISKQAARHVIQQDSGVSKLVWHLKTSILYSSGLDGVVRCFDAKSGQQLSSYTGHSADILDLSISSDGKTILTTSDDSTARIFKTGDERN